MNDTSVPSVEWVLNSLYMAETVFLKKLKPMEPAERYPGKYQFMRVKASTHSLWCLFKSFDRLSMAGIMKPSEAAEFKHRICLALVEEFARKRPPEEGKAYRFAGISDYDHVMLEIVNAAENKTKGE